MSKPLVSVITASLNQAAFLEQSLRSIRQQTYDNLEHVVVDGASKDGTLEILQRYGDYLHWVSEPDRGVSEAVNRGLRMAHGDVLCLLPADDFFEPDTVQKAVAALERNPWAKVVYGDCNIVDGKGQVLRIVRSRDFSYEQLLAGNFITCITVFMRRIVYETVGNFDESLHFAADYDYWMRTATSFPRGFKYTPEIVANFRIHPGSKSGGKSSEFLRENLEKLRAWHYSVLPLSPEYRPGLRRPGFEMVISQCYNKMGVGGLVQLFRQLRRYYPEAFWDRRFYAAISRRLRQKVQRALAYYGD